MRDLDLVEFEKRIREIEINELNLFKMGQMDSPTLFRPAGYLQKAEDGSDGVISFVASEESEDRMGDVILAGGWDLTNFKKNPVILFQHDRSLPPIGRAVRVAVEGKQLMEDVEFDKDDSLAALVENKLRTGFMKAVSVGFRPLEFEEREAKNSIFGRGLLFKKQELLETSVVSVPAHPKALKKAIDSMKFSIVIPTDIKSSDNGVTYVFDNINDEERLIFSEKSENNSQTSSETVTTNTADYVMWVDETKDSSIDLDELVEKISERVVEKLHLDNDTPVIQEESSLEKQEVDTDDEQVDLSKIIKALSSVMEED